MTDSENPETVPETSAEPNAAKRCYYKGCGKDIENSPFPLCDDCRAIENRDILTMVQDLDTPIQFVTHGVNKLITQMTGPEAIARIKRIEEVYFAFQKVMHQYGVSENTKRIQRTLREQIDEAHTLVKNIDARRTEIKKKDKKKKSVANLLGVDERTAEKWMNEDIDL